MRLAVVASGLLAAALASGTAMAQGSEAAEIAEARAIIGAVMPPEQRNAMVEQVINQLTGQLADSLDLDKLGDPGLLALFTDYRKDLIVAFMPKVRENLPKIAEAMAVAYTHEFSLAELKDIHAFADTPAGRHYLSRSAAIIGDPTVAAVNTAHMRELQIVAAPKMAEFKKRVLAYFEAHPEVAKKIAARENAR